MAVWYAIRKNVSAFFIWDNNNTKTTFDWIDSEQYFNLHKIDWFPFSPDISMRKFSVFFLLKTDELYFFFIAIFHIKTDILCLIFVTFIDPFDIFKWWNWKIGQHCYQTWNLCMHSFPSLLFTEFLTFYFSDFSIHFTSIYWLLHWFLRQVTSKRNILEMCRISLWNKNTEQPLNFNFM